MKRRNAFSILAEIHSSRKKYPEVGDLTAQGGFRAVRFQRRGATKRDTAAASSPLPGSEHCTSEWEHRSLGSVPSTEPGHTLLPTPCSAHGENCNWVCTDLQNTKHYKALSTCPIAARNIREGEEHLPNFIGCTASLKITIKTWDRESYA